MTTLDGRKPKRTKKKTTQDEHQPKGTKQVNVHRVEARHLTKMKKEEGSGNQGSRRERAGWLGNTGPTQLPDAESYCEID